MDGRGCTQRVKGGEREEKRKWRHVRRENGQTGMQRER
jgi:hypothetical protein